MQKTIFLSLAKLFNDHGHRLYMIGGTTRDFLLGLEVLDYDFVTDATPEQIKEMVPDADLTFAKYGSVKTKSEGVKVDITTLREEGEYNDHRHPSYIRYIKEIEKDYIRRDFTINAIYIDENFNVLDFCDGVKDLKNKIIRFIGDPEKRIKEDPLRIVRAERFKAKLDFEFDRETEKAINKYKYLLNELNVEKIKEENRKNKLNNRPNA